MLGWISRKGETWRRHAGAGGARNTADPQTLENNRINLVGFPGCQGSERGVNPVEGVLVLEELEHARARGAPILAEFLGGSCTCDAHHMTEPQPQGRGVRLCIEKCAPFICSIFYIYIYIYIYIVMPRLAGGRYNVCTVYRAQG
jgi:hypothetical protein